MRITDFHTQNQEMIEQSATLLVEGFKEHWPRAWPDLGAALEEVRGCLGPGRINRITVDDGVGDAGDDAVDGGADDGSILLGWIGASREYGGNTWELHPLVVHPDHQGQGIGRALVADLEARVREQGGITIYLGTDDEDNMTSLANKDLYPNVVEHIAHIRNLRRHPYEFYQKLGYVIVGAIPDANGPGRPDIIMAKRVRSDQTG
jgi:aminoglycoside 6'-N-acetyltransferase I